MMNTDWRCFSTAMFSIHWFLLLTHQVLVRGLSEQHFRNISQNESDDRGCQHHGGHVVGHFGNSVPDQSTAHFIEMHFTAGSVWPGKKIRFMAIIISVNKQSLIQSSHGCSPSDVRVSGPSVIFPQHPYLSVLVLPPPDQRRLSIGCWPRVSQVTSAVIGCRYLNRCLAIWCHSQQDDSWSAPSIVRNFDGCLLVKLFFCLFGWFLNLALNSFALISNTLPCAVKKSHLLSVRSTEVYQSNVTKTFIINSRVI